MSRKNVSEANECVHCGKPVPSGAEFCPNCGEPVEENSMHDESTSSEEEMAPVEKKEETGKSYDLSANPFVPKQDSSQVPKKPSMKGEQVSYNGTIRGSVTQESKNFLNTPGEVFFQGVRFSIKLEENVGIEEILNELTVFNFTFVFMGIGDKVILQGRVIKNFDESGRAGYYISADHFYNESLQIGDEGFRQKTYTLYEGVTQGLVTREPKISVDPGNFFLNIQFPVKLVENTGIKEVPTEILVQTKKPGYFRIGDKVILQGKILRKDLKQWGKPMYVFEADHFYNESLQIGDGEIIR